MRTANERNQITFGKHLAAAMAACKLTQHALAEKAGVPQPTISVICSGKRAASVETMAKICESLEWGHAQRVAASYFQLVGCGDLASFVTVVPATEDTSTDLQQFDRSSSYALSGLLARIKKSDMPAALDSLAVVIKAIS